MNERIQELIEQATTEEHDGFRYFDKAKFAELIIVKCANVVWDEAEKTDNHQVNDAGYKILEHFGIETDDEVEYCPKCDAEWSGTSCGLPDCGWIVGDEE